MIFGLILITPIVITIFIVNLLFKITTKWVVTFVPAHLLKVYPAVLFQAAALVIVLMFVFFVGLLTRNILGKRLYQLGDFFMTKIPFINKIYVWVRQISETVLEKRQTLFKEVVLVEYPRKGLWSMGFVTANVPPHIIPGSQGIDRVAVFIATVPNPTTGFFIFVPRSEVVVLPFSIGEAMKLLFSAGAVYPGTDVIDDRPTLLDKLEVWMAAQSKSDAKSAVEEKKPE
jgi:uncharacterized membrane protein